MTQHGQGIRFRRLHRALADPLRLRLLEYLIVRPRSVRELADLVDMRPDRLYHHLSRLEEAGLVAITEYRRLPRGKVERIYAAAEVEPPGDETSPLETARFFGAVIEATRADLNSALAARDTGQHREISLTRTPLRLSDEGRAELVAGFERLIREAEQKPDPAGTWTHIVWTLVDAEDRRPPAADPEEHRLCGVCHPEAILNSTTIHLVCNKVTWPCNKITWQRAHLFRMLLLSRMAPAASSWPYVAKTRPIAAMRHTGKHPRPTWPLHEIPGRERGSSARFAGQPRAGALFPSGSRTYYWYRVCRSSSSDADRPVHFGMLTSCEHDTDRYTMRYCMTTTSYRNTL